MYILADSSIQNPGGKVDMGTGPALVYHPPGISSDATPGEPAWSGSSTRPVW